MLLEAESFIYADSSIFFESGDFVVLFEQMNSGSLTHFQMSGNTGHTIRFATHKGELFEMLWGGELLARVGLVRFLQGNKHIRVELAQGDESWRAPQRR